MITAATNSRLSRRVLWGIILLYILPGLFARAPWTPDDAVGFGQAYTLMNKPFSEWALSFIGDRMYAEDGLLAAWLSALLGLLAKSLGAPLHWIDDAMRLGNVVWLIVAGWAIWNTTYRLARRAELQPEDPFGNAPTRVDYARAVADASVLCFISTLGLLVRSHFQVPEVAELAGISLLLLASVRSLDRPIGAGWMLGWGIAIAFFARGWSHLIPFLGLLLISSSTHSSLRFGLLRRLSRAGLVAGSLILLWFIWLISQPKGNVWWDSWNQWNYTRFLILNPEDSMTFDKLKVTLKNLAWFLWPTLPLASWAVWRYAKAFSEPAIRLPFAGTAAGILVLIITNPADEANYLPLIAPLSVLAAIGLSTLRRGLTSLIDWFALLWFTFAAGLVWLGWSAATFGLPEKMARNFEKLSPGYVPSLSIIEISVALLATAAWIRLVIWRTGKSSSAGALWRPLVLSSGGITLIWLLLMTLWIPRIDYAKSYAPVATRIKAELQKAEALKIGKELNKAFGKEPAADLCIGDYNLSLPQRSVLEYHLQIRFVHSPNPEKLKQCSFLLISDSTRSGMKVRAAFAVQHEQNWMEIWQGGRNSDRKEKLFLFVRASKPEANTSPSL